MAYIVSDGALAGVDRPAPVTTGSVQLSDTFTQDYAAIWRTQPNVRTVIDFLGRNIASVPLHVYQRVSDTDRARNTTDPLAVLLRRPGFKVTPYRLWDAVVHDKCIYDRAHLVKLKAGSARALMRVPPYMLSPVGGTWLAPESWRLKGSKGFVDIPDDQVVTFRGYNPTDPRVGTSPMETLRQTLAEQYTASQLRDQQMRNGARVSGYISRPREAPDWRANGGADRFIAQWRDQYVGDASQAGGTPVLEDGMTFTAASMNPKDLQYVESRKLSRSEVAAAFHIPEPMVGILDHATFSNIDTQHRMLYQDTLGPWLEDLQQEIELQLVDEVATTRDLYVEFNLADKLKGSFTEEAAALQTMVGAPIMTPNEGRARKNLPAVEGGDVLVVPLNVTQGGQASPTDSAPPANRLRAVRARLVRPRAEAVDDWAAQFEAVLRDFFARQGAVALDNVEAARPLGKLADWIDDLADALYPLNLDAATAAGRAALEALSLDPDLYDQARTEAWLRENADAVSEAVNRTTADAVSAAVKADDPKGALEAVFDTARDSRAATAGKQQAATTRGFGGTEAARQQSPTAQKKWKTGKNPRASHARLDGETVDIDGTFSNGGRWPGDHLLSDDETSGCNCDLEILL